MKYTFEITINQPRARVIELFDNPDNLAEWQPGFQSFEHLSGEPGQPGAKSRLVYDMNGREVEMIESITSRNLPDEFSGTYEADSVISWHNNHFYDAGSDKTRWVVENEFKFRGFMRVAWIFMRGALRKQTHDYLLNFKAFANRIDGAIHLTDIDTDGCT